MNKDPYRKIAGLYDKYVEPASRSLRKVGLKYVPARDGMRVLEVGCGTGTNLELYQNRGCEIYGIDLSPSMLKHAKEKLGPEAVLHLGDAREMPFEDNYFDLVIAMLVLHEMPHEMRNPVINEMKRVVDDKGQIMIIDYHPGPLKFPEGWFNRLIILFFEIAAGREHFRNFRNFLSHKGLHALLSDGLEIKKEKILAGGNLAVIIAKKKN